MLKKILSSIGIGSSKIDLVLPRERYRAGDIIEGYLRISGGISEQLVNKIYVQLVVESKHKDDDEVKNIVRVLDQATLCEGFRIEPGEGEREIPVSYALPENIPVTTSSTQLYLITGMDISFAVDPRDHDPVEVLPGPRQEIIMQALKELGFRRKRGTGTFNGHYQEFEYWPAGFMKGKLDELEVIYHVRSDGIGLFMQIDKKVRGLGAGLLDKLDLDERNVSLFLSNDQITTPREVASLLAKFIEQEYRKII